MHPLWKNCNLLCPVQYQRYLYICLFLRGREIIDLPQSLSRQFGPLELVNSSGFELERNMTKDFCCYLSANPEDKVTHLCLTWPFIVFWEMQAEIESSVLPEEWKGLADNAVLISMVRGVMGVLFLLRGTMPKGDQSRVSINSVNARVSKNKLK